jgi:hypothetical protein
VFADFFEKKADPFYPMPNTGTVLDCSAGQWVLGHKGQWIMNGGFALFWSIGAMPNMGKSTLAAAVSGAVLRAFSKSSMHVHDAETTMVIERIEALVRRGMGARTAYNNVPENLLEAGRMFFTRSVDYNATELFSLVKKFCKDRLKNEKKVKLEIIHPDTGKPYEYLTPTISFWDSFSAMKSQTAEEMLEENDIGHKDNNMLAMRANSGKSQIVDQISDLCAKHAFYLVATSQVGQAYELDPKKPSQKLLKMHKGEVKLKRVPENFSFSTGNCYIITGYSPLINGSGKDTEPYYPYEPGDEAQASDLIKITISNMRGKYGISGVPFPFLMSQNEGMLIDLSNYYWLKEDCGGFGVFAHDKGNRFFAPALMPDIKLQRTDLRLKMRENPKIGRAWLILVEMYWEFTYNNKLDQSLVCDPTALYGEIKNMGYDWNLLLDTRFWFMTVEDGEKIPYLSTMDLLRIRAGRYHPYWYPKSRKEMGLPPVTETGAPPEPPKATVIGPAT